MNLDSSSQIVGLTVGSFAASLNLIQDLFSPVKELGQDFQSLQEGFSGVSRVEEFLNEEEINGKDQTFTASYVLSRQNKPILQFDNLSFRYEDGTEYIFDHASFSLSSLDQASLTGRTGIGKTTLFKLILGLLPPTEGAILVNGVSTIQIPDEEKKKIFGYVEQ
ncbi:MAG: ATP-binding cassette domain-containing protein, partial [Bacilli bacterium]|nr:ATP-binding cassette domain-containing protein [Bacilli bacterium]